MMACINEYGAIKQKTSSEFTCVKGFCEFYHFFSENISQIQGYCLQARRCFVDIAPQAELFGY